ncbi:transposase [Lolliginicoccus levis]|uniref:transposase n=1 Tax=Lolliginicoccus levis TaxID=2919542 RepID=UPI00241D0BA0|nr:transposase [Lolliginicoccus levis]
MPKPYPKEFRDDVVRVARGREPGQQLKQIAADFGISESCLANWMKAADVEDGVKPGTTASENAELREARKRIRLLRGRTHGPVFLTHRRPGPGKYLADRDLCPDTEHARLSYDQARDLLDAATATDGPGTGWDLHELRHSGLTHLGESGASLLELMAKSRHRKAENLRRYFKPAPQAMRELTSLIGPGTSRTH